MTKRALELIRVSTAGQADTDKASIPVQRSINRQTALQYGLTIVRSIELSDVSGAQVLLAPEIQEMLKLMADPEIHGVIVREFSRLMRPENFADYAMLQQFVETNTILYLPEGPIDFSSNDGMLMGTMKAVIGGLERRELVKKMWRIKEEKRRAGGFSQPSHCLPFGVEYQDRWRYTGDSERVREAFRLLLSGETNFAAIGRRVAMSATSLRVVLRNPIYTGWRVIDKKRDPSPRAKVAKADGRQGDRKKIKRAPEEVIRVKVIDTPLVSEEQFNQAQRILDLKKANHWKLKDTTEHRFTYNGYLRCTCQRLVHTKYQRADYYACPGKCGAGYMRRDRLEPQIDVLFADRLTQKSFLRGIVKGLQKKRPQADTARMTAQLESLSGKRQRILDSYFDGVIDGTERDSRIAGVEREKGVVTGLITKQKPRPELDVQSLVEIFSPFAEFDLMNRNDKRQLLNTITPSITVANYQIKGMWIGCDLGRVTAESQGAEACSLQNNRIYLPLELAA